MMSQALEMPFQKIENNDILVVDRSLAVLPNSFVAVYFNGTPMCKQFVEYAGKKYLHSLNKKYKDLEITNEDELIVFGTVMGLVRDFF